MTAGTEWVDPAEDGRAFRQTLGQYGTGVTVITTLDDGVPTGMTVNSFAAVSLDPPLILWSLRANSRRVQAYTEGESFAVNVLSSEQVDISLLFATGGQGPEVFDRLPWSTGDDGLPLIDGAVAHLECRKYALYPGGDHQIILGRVRRCSVTHGEPLIFAQGGYAVPSSLTTTDKPLQAAPGAGVPEPFMQLVSAASHRLSARFDEHRARFGLNLAAGRLLQRLYAKPRTADELARTAYLAPRAVEDALAELIDDGSVEHPDGKYQLTAQGRQRREQIARCAEQFTADTLTDLSDSEVAATKKVLSALAQR